MLLKRQLLPEVSGVRDSRLRHDKKRNEKKTRGVRDSRLRHHQKFYACRCLVTLEPATGGKKWTKKKVYACNSLDFFPRFPPLFSRFFFLKAAAAGAGASAT